MTDHALYRFYDAGDQLLYIGITANIGSRFKQHAGDKPWWTEVHRITLEHYATREDVLTAETAAIVAEHPRYNVVHNRNRPDPRPIRLPKAPMPTSVEDITPDEWIERFMAAHPRVHGPWPEPKPKPCAACGETLEAPTRAIRAGGRLDVVHQRCRDEWDRNHPQPPDDDHLALRRIAVMLGDIA